MVTHSFPVPVTFLQYFTNFWLKNRTKQNKNKQQSKTKEKKLKAQKSLLNLFIYFPGRKHGALSRNIKIGPVRCPGNIVFMAILWNPLERVFLQTRKHFRYKSIDMYLPSYFSL